MLTHLYDSYAQIIASELLLNNKAMKEHHSAILLIEILYDQIDTYVEYVATGGAPCTPEQIVTIVFQIIFQTGLFPDDCKLWKCRVLEAKTYAAFKLFFMAAHLELQEA